MSLVSTFSLILAASELGLAVFKRAKADAAASADRGSLRLLWLVILLSIGGAYAAAHVEPLGFSCGPLIPAAPIALFVGGLALRAFAIIHLGKFFTVNVAIATQHRVVDTGPYTYVRHPSYTGILLEFFAMGLAFCNWGSLAAMTIPTFIAFSWRIRIEEAALLSGLGNVYREYMSRTKRLIPSVY